MDAGAPGLDQGRGDRGKRVDVELVRRVPVLGSSGRQQPVRTDDGAVALVDDDEVVAEFVERVDVVSG